MRAEWEGNVKSGDPYAVTDHSTTTCCKSSSLGSKRAASTRASRPCCATTSTPWISMLREPYSTWLRHRRCSARHCPAAPLCRPCVGVDLSSVLAQTPARLAAEEGFGGRLEFRAGDSRSLELADGDFDAVVAHTLLSHVDEPLSVLREAARLVRPGGIIGIFDGDYASITFGHADPAKGKSNDDAIVRGIVTSPSVMRQMPRLLQHAGLQLVTSFPYILAEVGKADFWAPAIESFRRLMSKAGTMTIEEADAWAEHSRRTRLRASSLEPATTMAMSLDEHSLLIGYKGLVWSDRDLQYNEQQCQDLAQLRPPAISPAMSAFRPRQRLRLWPR